MDLKDFIKNTISQISHAIVESNEELKETGAIVNPKKVTLNRTEGTYGFLGGDFAQTQVHLIDFNVAVTTSENKGKDGGISVQIAGIGIGGGADKQTANQTLSRLSFKIPVAFPVGDNKRQK